MKGTWSQFFLLFSIKMLLLSQPPIFEFCCLQRGVDSVRIVYVRNLSQRGVNFCLKHYRNQFLRGGDAPRINNSLSVDAPRTKGSLLAQYNVLIQRKCFPNFSLSSKKDKVPILLPLTICFLGVMSCKILYFRKNLVKLFFFKV